MADQRDHDIALFGATGFTGRLVAERLAERTDGLRIALAGRSLARLAALRDTLGEPAAQWPLILCDAEDSASVNLVARSARAVATTVGPYSRHGLPLVGACARAGTHYVDLAGEVTFMARSIDDWDEVARRSGARIVHACGFDSIPSDLGVLILSRSVGELADTTLVVRQLRGGFSGGTIDSGREEARIAASDPRVKERLKDPYSLSPDREAEPDLGPQPDMARPGHDPRFGWIGPFVMATVNSRVVRRSNALAGYPYGREFRYREVMGFGEGVTARARALGVSAGMGALGAAVAFGPTRAGAALVVPKPGEGPSAKQRAEGRFEMTIHGDDPDGGWHEATVAAQGDPGYAATSMMFAESAVLAAVGDPDLPDRAGILTPATAFGMPLVTRLRAAGMTFEVDPHQDRSDADQNEG